MDFLKIVNLAKFTKKTAIIYYENIEKSLTFDYEYIVNNSQQIIDELKRLNIINQYIGVYFSHSPALIAVILGIINSHSTFCCIDGSKESEIYESLKTLKCSFCFTNRKLIDKNAKLISSLKVFNSAAYLYRIQNSENILINDQKYFLYCIQTSGSTGTPKIVRVPSRCIQPNIDNLCKLFKLSQNDLIFVSSPPTFDPFIIDLFFALKTGSSLLLVANSLRLDPNALFDIFVKENVSFLQMTPSLFCKWSKDQMKKLMQTLRILVLGGEKFPVNCFCDIEDKITKVYNIYGITEISCWSTIKEILSFDEEPSLGSCIDEETEFEIRENELFIGSSTRKCVIDDEDPDIILKNSFKVFRATGDEIEIKGYQLFYKGRCNDIVKRYGKRTNLKKIEHVLDKFTNIQTSSCIFIQEHNLLVAFYTSKTQIDEDKLWKALRKILKDEIPDELHRIERIPLSCHGKVSKIKLFHQYKTMKRKSSTEIDIFLEELKKTFEVDCDSYEQTDQMSIKKPKTLLGSSFTQIGGTSILALQIVSKLETHTNQNYPKLIEMLLNDNLPLNDVIEYLSFTKAQVKLEKSHFNVSYSLKITETFDLGKCIDATPSIFENLVSIGSHSHILLNIIVETNEIVSKIELPDRIESQVEFVENYFGIVGCYDGFLYNFNIFNGQIKWKFNSYAMIKCKSLILGKFVIFGNYSEKFNLFCLQTDDGKLIWSIKLGEKGILSSPLKIDEETIFVATLDGTTALMNSLTGSILKKGLLTSPIFSNPKFIEKCDIILIAEVNGMIHALSSNTLAKIWTFQAGGNVFSSFDIVEGNCEINIFFGCHDKHLYCLEYDLVKATISVKFKLHIESKIYSTPKLVRNELVICCSTNGVINIINWKKEEICGRIKLNGEIFSTPAVFDSKSVFVGCRDNNLYKLEIDKIN